MKLLVTFFSSVKPKRVTIKDEFMTLDVNHLTRNVNYEDVVTSDNNSECEESVSKGTPFLWPISC